MDTGFYSLPHCADMKQMNDEAMQNRFKEGPVAFIAIFPKGMPPMSIWCGHPWPTTFEYLIDALIYAVVVAATFAWMWLAAG